MADTLTAPNLATEARASDTPDVDMSGLQTIDGSSAQPPPAQISQPATTHAPEPKPAPAKEAAKPEPKPEDKPKPEDGLEDEPKEEQPPSGQQPTTDPKAAPAKKTAWQLVREREKELKEVREQHEAATKELTALKAQPKTPANDAEIKQLRDQLAKYEEEIRYTNYEKSQEFQEKYLKPYQDTAKRLTAEAMEVVREVDGQFVALTDKEFWSIVSSPTLAEAGNVAKALLPNDPTMAAHLLKMRAEIQNSWNAMHQAKEEYRVKGAEREKTQKAEAERVEREQQEKQKQTMTARQQRFREMSEAALNEPKLADLFKAADDDAKGKELLTKGFKSADRAFGEGERNEAGELIGDDGKPLDEDQLLAIYSSVRNKAGAFNYVSYKYRNALNELAEVKRKLAQYESSTPGAGTQPGKESGAKQEDDLDSALAKLAIPGT